MYIPSLRIALAVLTGSAVIMTVTFLFFGTETVEITRTESGFMPKALYITKGQTVHFRSVAGKPYWPASDYHPSHGRYPAFDPKRELKPPETWEFTFTQPGVWFLHDHLDPRAVATIFVEGEANESIESCLRSNTDTIKAICWEGALRTAIERGGLSAGFEKFGEWYENEPQFKRNCHDVGHVLGKIAYRAYKDTGIGVVEPETTYCGYGFYHGFIETAMLESGNFDLATAVAYCTALRDNPKIPNKHNAHNITGACFHGIGHAVFDSLNGNLWGDDTRMVSSALAICEREIQGSWERGRCATGIFNSLAVAYSGRNYKLDFNDAEPLRACTVVAPVYHSSCAMEVGLHYARDRNFSIQKSLEFFARFSDATSTIETTQAYMDDEIRRNRDNPDLAEYTRICTTLTNQAQSLACARGLVFGFSLSSPSGHEHERVLDSCSFYNTHSPLRKHCMETALHVIQEYRDKDAMFRTCDTLSSSDRSQLAHMCAR